jgi:amino acid permease
MAPGRSIQFRPATALLVLVAIGCIVVGVIYLTTAADKLPSLLPGHQAHVTRHHTKHGIAMFGLAVLALVGAWFTTAPAGEATASRSD